jgi:ATP-dependent Clp protease adaptor protein ClpS
MARSDCDIPKPTSFLNDLKRYIASFKANHRILDLMMMQLHPYVQMMSGPADDDGDTTVVTDVKPKTKRPPLYKVLLLNDDYTPMEFVVHVLERFFGLNHAQAFEIMLTVHKKGLAVVGVFSHEIAETKVAQVMDYARRHQHPLQCTMEKEE